MRIFFVLATLIIWTSPAASLTIANCGASVGVSYFAKKGLASKAKSGEWHRNAISNGKISLILSDQDQHIDLLHVDATGVPTSARAEGGVVSLITQGKTHHTVIIAYEGKTIETYVFSKDADGKNEVLWTQVKYYDLTTSASVFRAPCSFILFPKSENPNTK